MSEQETADLHWEIAMRFDQAHIRVAEDGELAPLKGVHVRWQEPHSAWCPDYNYGNNWAWLLEGLMLVTRGVFEFEIENGIKYFTHRVANRRGERYYDGADTFSEAVVACAVATMEAEKEKP